MIRAATMAAAASFLLFWLTLLAAEVEAKPKDDDEAAIVTVNFPGLSDVHVYLHSADGVPGAASGPQITSSTWKSNAASLSVAKGTYDLRVVHGPVTSIIDAVDCRAATCSASVPLATLSVSFPGLSDAHTYAHVSDGAPATYGAQDSSSTWKSGGTSLVLLQGVYDVRVVHGPVQTVLDAVDCRAGTCSASVPLATLSVDFPGLTDSHAYAHVADGTPGSYGAQDSSSTWKSGGTSLVLLQGVYDVRVVHGPVQTVLDAVDCRSTTCSASVPLATLSVSFPGLSDAHTYAHVSDGAPATYGAQDSSSTWKSGSTSLVLLQGVYDVRVVHGPVQAVLDAVDCRAATCSASVPLATLSVSFPGLSDAHTYAHVSDGAPATYGAQDSSSTWKSGGTSLVLLQGVYDVRVVHGPVQTVLDAVDCRAETCSASVPLATLTVDFPGHSNLHSYVRVNDGVAGAAGGATVSSSTWRTNSASFVLLQGIYDVLMREGGTDRVADSVDCRSLTCTTTLDEAQALAGASATPTTSPTTNATATPTAAAIPTASPTTGAPGTAAAGSAAEGKVLVHKRVYDAKKGDWKPATPAKSWTFEAHSGSTTGPLLATFNDTEVTTVPAGAVTITEVVKPGYEIYSLTKNTTGGSSCPDTPTAGPAQVVLTAADFAAAGTGTMHLCAYNRATKAAPPKISLNFVEAKAGMSSWRLTPETDADIYIWDETAAGCTAFNGALCGDIAEGGRGTFFRATAGQSLLVTQPYTVNGESCEIEHQAEFALAASPDSHLDVTGRYRCSGAPVLGPWWLLMGFAGAVALAWHVRRVRG